ncbi:hypothetical protein NN561_015754 [Cricetulus griseus]
MVQVSTSIILILHIKDKRYIIRACLRRELRRSTRLPQRSPRAVLAPPPSPATLHRSWRGVGASVRQAGTSSSSGPWGSSGFARTGRRPTAPPPPSSRAAPRAARGGSKPLGAIPCVTGRLKPPLAGACHVQRATLAIGWRAGRARGCAGRGGVIGCRAAERPRARAEGRRCVARPAGSRSSC